MTSEAVSHCKYLLKDKKTKFSFGLYSVNYETPPRIPPLESPTLSSTGVSLPSFREVFLDHRREFLLFFSFSNSFITYKLSSSGTLSTYSSLPDRFLTRQPGPYLK